MEDELVEPHEVCSDNRGYWGDYNDVALREPVHEFILVKSDSSDGCEVQQTYNSHHLHVDAVLF